MKIMKITAIGTLAVFAAVLTFSACKKDRITDNTTNTTTGTDDSDTQYADDMARTEQAFDEAQNFADEADATGNVEMKGGPAPLSGCATVTRDTVSVPHTITIDFGTTNCLCRDGRYRRGKIIISYSGRYRDSGFVHSIGFDGYHINDNEVLGGKTVQNMGHNSSGQTYYNISVNGMMIMNTTGDTVKHIASRTRTWIAGESTPLRSDDKYSITGSGSITKRNGKVFNMSITSPLIVALNCNWIEQGVVAITPAGASSARTLDYGSGTCDNHAVLTVNGHSHNITLR